MILAEQLVLFPEPTQIYVGTSAPDPALVPAPVEQLRELDAELAAAGPHAPASTARPGRWVELEEDVPARQARG